MSTSVDTVTQVSTKFRRKKKINKNMGISVEHNTNNTYENGDKCVPIWKSRNAYVCLDTHTQGLE